jgi:NADH-quinone oxidoreductase subunit J
MLGNLETLLFDLLALVAVISALVVVGQRNPTYSALALIVTLGSLSGIFGLLGSPFVAVLQVVVYAGAIMVLFLFVIMLLNVKAEDQERGEGRAFKGTALVLGLVLVLEMALIASRANPGPAPSPLDASTKAMAMVLFSAPYLYVFEATSVLILAALVGAVVLAKKDL